jgi:hypothetical protein
VEGLIESYGLEAVNVASLEVLSFPAVMVTNGGERYRVSLKLRGISPPQKQPVTRRLSVTNKQPQEPVKTQPVTPKQPQLVARSLF